jgi:energy-coupling factor transporter ATP-binding protein EcfA2
MQFIELQEVSFRYEGRHENAVTDLSLRVREGEFVLILGGTGAGKSTLLRLLNGLIPHFYKGEFKGKVVVNGIDTRDASVAELARHVGLVFQNPENQLVALTVEREIAFGLENLGVPRAEMRKKVLHYLNTLGITHLKDRPLYNISGGEKHLVTLASVLVMEPSFLVLDEPTSELDPYNSRVLARVIKGLHEDGRTIIVAEHRAEVFAGFATRVVAMKEGRIIRDGLPEEVLFDIELLRECRIKPLRTAEIWNELKKRNVDWIRPTLDEDLFLEWVSGGLIDRGR